MSNTHRNTAAQARPRRTSYWSNLLMLGSIVLILAIVAAPLWR